MTAQPPTAELAEFLAHVNSGATIEGADPSTTGSCTLTV